MPGPSDKPEILDGLRASVGEFVRCIEALPEDAFLSPIVNWTPRDVVAHLIGWNVYMREGCDEMRAGRTPNYLNDGEHDYRHVNAASVKRYAGTDKRTLLGELQGSFRTLEQYLAGLEAGVWDADTGVRYRGRPVTIRNSVRALARDYDNHRRRLEEWSTGRHGE